MISLTFLSSLLLLIPKLIKQVILHYTVGANIHCTDVRTLMRCVVVNHAMTYALPLDHFYALERNRSLTTVLRMANTAIQRESGARALHNHGRVFEDSPQGRARWLVEAIDRRPEDPVVFYLHGGAFFFPTFDSQLKALTYLYQGLRNDRLSILIVDYTTAPEAQYPVALNETTFLYHSLMVERGARNVTVLGDSAGGNLAILLMKHLTTPFAEVTPLIPAKYKPVGAILISPATNLVPQDTGSCITNATTDILSTNALHSRISLYEPDETRRGTFPLSPVNSVSNDWVGVFPEKMLITAGGCEILHDDIIAFAHLCGVTPTVEPRGWHDEFMFYTHSFDVYSKSWSYLVIQPFLKKTTSP